MSFECGICGTKKGKNLNYFFGCDHLYCETCLYPALIPAISSLSKEDKDISSKFNCPLCERESFKSIQEFLMDYKALTREKPNKKLCEACEENELNMYCYKCKIFYCTSCLENKHNKLKAFQNHFLSEDLTVRPNMNFCNCLKDRIVRFICLSCETNMCEICTISFHLEHHLKSISHENNVVENQIKKELREKIKSFMDFDKIISNIDFLINTSEKFSTQTKEECLKLKEMIEEGTKGIITLFSQICSSSTNKINSYIEIYRRQVARLRLQQKTMIKFLGQVKHPLLFLKSLTPLEKLKQLQKLNRHGKNIHSEIFNDVSWFAFTTDLQEKRKITIIDGKIVFKGENVKNFKEKANLVISSNLYEEVLPSMIVSFRGNSGHCFIAYINNRDYSIELVNITKVENFKPYSGRIMYKDLESETKSVRRGERDRERKEDNLSFKKLIKIEKTNEDSVKGIKSSSQPKMGKNMKESRTQGSMSTYKKHSSRRKSTSIVSNNPQRSSKGYSKKFVEKPSLLEPIHLEENSYTIKAHYDTIYGIRHYKIEKDDFLLSFSEDRIIKLWSCDYLQEVVTIDHESPVRSASLTTFESFKYIIAGSYIKDFPVAVYSFNGSFLKEYKIKGFTYHIDSFCNDNQTFIFISTYQPYTLIVIDFESGEKLYSIPTTCYVNSIIVNVFDTPIMTFIDRYAKVSQFDLQTGKMLFEGNGYGNYHICKWNEKHYIFSGKGTGFLVVDINDLSIVCEYQGVHNDLVKGVCKFQHHIYGEVLITIGQDSRINILK